MRPLNLLLAAVGTASGAIVGGAVLGVDGHLVPVLAAAFVGAAGTAGGNLLNDLMDIELDRRAHPGRPLASGLVRPVVAWTALVVLFILAVGLSFVFDPVAGGLAVFLVGILVLYETRLKRIGLSGNLAVALAAGALFPLGALIVGTVLTPALILGLLAALAHLGRELLKDAQDVEADRGDRMTFAVRHGAQAAARLAVLPFTLAVLLSPLPVPFLDWPPIYLGLVAPAVFLFLLAATVGLRASAHGQRAAKAAMALALVAFLVTSRL